MRQFEFLQVHLDIALSVELIFVVEPIFEFACSLFFNGFCLLLVFWIGIWSIFLFGVLSGLDKVKFVIMLLFNDSKIYSFLDKLLPYTFFMSDKRADELCKIILFIILLFAKFLWIFSLFRFSLLFSWNEEESSSLKSIFLYLLLLLLSFSSILFLLIFS